jgi:serine/threonine protein kinase
MHPETDFPIDLRALESDYELIRELGRGGVTAVYLARRRDTGTLVAIKAIRARYLDDLDALHRFAREARTVAGLSHPNIVRTEAIKEIGDRAVAIIMEYVEGGTVRDRLREYGPLSAEDAETVLRDVANALGYAHRRGIVHRDVKPENVFLDKRTGRALLADFGIARRIEDDERITMLGASLGTPQYMSPEQIDGASVDGRTDIYSLGVLGWELLTGERPWAGESLYGVIYKQKHEDLPRITSLRPRVSANVLFAIEGALDKNREGRWQNIDQFLDCLTYNPPPVLAHGRQEGEPAPADSPTVRFRRIATPPSATPASATIPPADDVDSADPGLHERMRRMRQPPGLWPPEHPAHDRVAWRRVTRTLALVVPLAIAGVSWYVWFDGASGAPSTRPKAPGRVTSSAGTIELDTNRSSRSNATKASARVTPPAVRPDSVDSDMPSPRCRIATTPDQRACLRAHAALTDAPLERVYNSLLAEMRRTSGVAPDAPDPHEVRQLRVAQRNWIARRERTCMRDQATSDGGLWAPPLFDCFTEMSATRRRDLAAALAVARGEPR